MKSHRHKMYILWNRNKIAHSQSQWSHFFGIHIILVYIYSISWVYKYHRYTYIICTYNLWETIRLWSDSELRPCQSISQSSNQPQHKTPTYNCSKGNGLSTELAVLHSFDPSDQLAVIWYGQGAMRCLRLCFSMRTEWLIMCVEADRDWEMLWQGLNSLSLHNRTVSHKWYAHIIYAIPIIFVYLCYMYTYDICYTNDICIPMI